jgi:hypothetical protein
VLNASRTRRGFLEKVLSPILSSNNGNPTTLSELLAEVSKATNKLYRFGASGARLFDEKEEEEAEEKKLMGSSQTSSRDPCLYILTNHHKPMHRQPQQIWMSISP